jgi:BlaI family transcriptional regulator, penicillinase repressor
LEYEFPVHLRTYRIMEKLSPQEEEAMVAIWKTGPGFIKDFMQAMLPTRLPYTTLASIIKNLEKKGFIKSERFANAFRYTVVIKEADYKKKYMHGVVNNLFKSSYKELVAFFAKDKKISTEELKEIIELIENSKK